MVDFLLIFHLAKLVRGVVTVEPDEIVVVKLPVFHALNLAVAL
jgi:hypothetical protein